MYVLCSNVSKIIVGELTVPWAESIGEAQQRKLNRYEELRAEIDERGWKVEVIPFEVGCRGFPAASLGRFSRAIGASGSRSVAKEMGERAEEGSTWILRAWAQQETAVADPLS